MTKMIDYRYDECGLDNVVLKGLPVCTDDDGEEVITIPNVGILHQILVAQVASKDGGLVPKEIRFLRTEMGLTQAQLADVVGRDAQTIGRWERGETAIEKAHELVLRRLAIENSQREVATMKELADRTLLAAGDRPYLIDARDPSDYQPIAA
jgi:DNA-binding transcriptional regulator YiaG